MVVILPLVFSMVIAVVSMGSVGVVCWIDGSCALMTIVSSLSVVMVVIIPVTVSARVSVVLLIRDVVLMQRLAMVKVVMSKSIVGMPFFFVVFLFFTVGEVRHRRVTCKELGHTDIVIVEEFGD